jgi:hypothetical protein
MGDYMDKTVVRRTPNPFTFNGRYTVVLDRWKGTIFELEGDVAALYQILSDEYMCVEELSTLFEKKYGKPLDPAYLECLKEQDGLVDVRVE